eukprot:1509730-Alexandrium_andersonii.AAC.1
MKLARPQLISSEGLQPIPHVIAHLCNECTCEFLAAHTVQEDSAVGGLGKSARTLENDHVLRHLLRGMGA